MLFPQRDRRIFLAAVFFTFGVICGIITARCGSAAMAGAVSQWLADICAASVTGFCILSAVSMPIILLFLGTTLLGAFLILPCVLLYGGVLGWLLCCLIRCGAMECTVGMLCLAVLIPQIPCMLRIAAASMRMAEALRSLAADSGLRRPDISGELQTMAVCFVVLLLSALLLALYLKRRFLIP